MKQRNASAGVQTIGSPRTLKLVFHDHRAAGLSFERTQQGAIATIGLGVDGLYASRVVHMRHGWNLGPHAAQPVEAGGDASALRAAVRPDVSHQQHVGTVALELEPIRHVFAQHAGREGAEGFAMLHFQVERPLHGGGAGVGQDGAIAERTRPELHPALKPANRVAGREGPRPWPQSTCRPVSVS